MKVTVYRKKPKRKVSTFSNVEKIEIIDNDFKLYFLFGCIDTFDLSLFDFYILQ